MRAIANVAPTYSQPFNSAPAMPNEYVPKQNHPKFDGFRF